MLLVDYPSSASDDENEDETTDSGRRPKPESDDDVLEVSSTKRKADQACDTLTPRSKLPRLPTSFHSLYSSSARKSASDDPALHGGRKRQIPHVQGNWPSHLYLEWLPDSLQRSQIGQIIQQAQNNVVDQHALTSFLTSPLDVQQPLHISLSAPLILTTATKDDFQNTLTAKIQAAKIPSFYVRARSLDWVSNFESTRYFLILRVETSHGDELNRLLKICNAVCKQFGLPLLYQTSTRVGVKTPSISSNEIEHAMAKDGSDSLHISIAWMLEESSEEAKKAVKLCDLGLLLQEQIVISEVTVKIGNMIKAIHLEKPVANHKATGK